MTRGRGLGAWMSVVGALVAPTTAAATGRTQPFGVEPEAADVVMATDGTTVYAGNQEIDGEPHAIVRVRPPGGPVGAVQRLGDSPSATSERPVIATGPGGHVAAAWSRALRVPC